MSTILEALRRAEAERIAAPGSTLPPLGMAAPAALPAGRRSALRIAWGLLLVLLVGAAIYPWIQRPSATVPVPPPSAAAAAQPSPAPLPAPAALLQTPGARALPEPSPATPAAAVARTVASAPPPQPAAPTASAPARVPRLAELPAALRQQLPPLQLGGSMHSPDPRLRSLILNGQLVREGDQLAPDLKLEEIGLRGARLRWREQVFELPY